MIHIHKLVGGYKERGVINVPQLDISPQSKCLLTGASGSGKTTLLYALAALGGRLSGDIMYHDDPRSLYAMTEAQRDRFRADHIGIVFQNLHLVKGLTVEQNILLPTISQHQPIDDDYKTKVINRLGLSAIIHHSASQISQGQAQRVAIARAVIGKPRYLFADEPTSSLDNQSAQNVMHMMMDLVIDNKATLVVSSHDDRITPFFDRILSVEEFTI